MSITDKDILARLTAPPVLDLPADDVARLPDATTWALRPALWSAPSVQEWAPLKTGTVLVDYVTAHHDCADAAQAHGALDGLTLQTSAAAGDYLSLAIGMGTDAVAQTTRTDILRLQLEFATQLAITAYARLNMVYGPSKEEVPLELKAGEAAHVIEWDLSFTDFDPLRGKDIWVDLIFEAPATMRVDIHDLLLSRHPRANF